jgi:PAS domain S-box-containing protein
MKYISLVLILISIKSFSIDTEDQVVDINSEPIVCSVNQPLQTDETLGEQISTFFSSLLNTQSWPARWQCGTWSPFHGWFYILSDTIIAISYFLIPFVLLYYISKRKMQSPFQLVILLFISFIMACGFTHLIDATIFWWPAYRLSAVIRFVTAAISMTTVFALYKVTPELLSLKSPKELEQVIQKMRVIDAELNRSKSELEKNEKRLIDAQAVAKIGSWEIDLLTLEVNWSTETYRIFDLKSDFFEPRHTTFLDYVHPDDRLAVNEAFSKSYQNEGVNVIEHRIITASGKIKWVEEHWNVYHNEYGTPTRTIGTCQDITERKLVEHQFKSAKALSDSLINSLPGVFYLVNKDGQFSRWNKNFETISGYSSEEILDMHPVDFFESQEKEFIQNVFERTECVSPIATT